MDNSRRLLEEKEKVRYEVLREIYDLTNGQTDGRLDLSRFFRTMNLSPQDIEIQNAINYLEEEHLIECTTLEYAYSITHKGVKEVEQSIRNPERATEHFSSPIIQIFAPVGAIQTGNNNNSYVSQVNNISTEVQDAINDLKRLIGSLPENQKRDASELIEDLQQEIVNPTRQSRLKSSLVALWQLGKEVAGFANSVSAVAQRFGIDLSSF